METDLKTCVVGSGWLLLDAYFSLSRKAMSSIELSKVEDLLMTTNYACLQLQVWKNKLLNKSIQKSPKEIKPHMTMHFIDYWRNNGTPLTYNSYQQEAAHPDLVKNPFKASSRRRGTVLSEMFGRVNRRQLFRRGKREYNAFKGLAELRRGISEDDLRTHKCIILTEADVVIECSTENSNRHELRINRISGDDLCPVRNGRDFAVYLNPTCTLDYVYEQLSKNCDLDEFMKHFRDGHEGIFA
jgi:hypothetical protein